MINEEIMLKRLILSIGSRIPTGKTLVICLVATAGLVVVGGATVYQYASRADRHTDSSVAKPKDATKVETQSPEKELSNGEPSSEPNATTPQSQNTQPTTTATKPPAQKPTQVTPIPPPTTTATIVVGSLAVGAASSDGGLCSIPVSTSVKTNFNGSVTLHFASHDVATGQRNTFSKYVTTSPGAVVPVQYSLTFINPGTYAVDITMSVSASSYPQAYSGPAISYGGSTMGTATCENY